MPDRKNYTHFVITYRDPTAEKTTSLRVKTIGDSPLGLSFVRVSDFVFDTSSLVVKPDEEALRKRLENVKSLHLSIYTIFSIEEVGEENTGLTFSKDKSNLFVLPGFDKKGPPDPK